MEKDFDRWNKKKKALNETDFTDYVHEREVWWCALGVNVGLEADGKHDNFERPVLVL
jgi:mRNA interferase MazF